MSNDIFSSFPYYLLALFIAAKSICVRRRRCFSPIFLRTPSLTLAFELSHALVLALSHALVLVLAHALALALALVLVHALACALALSDSSPVLR